MSQTKLATMMAVNKDDYNIHNLADEIRVDQQCQALLSTFHQYLLANNGTAPLLAGSLARGADYFLRDFVIDRLLGNIFLVSAQQVRGFAGNWYIHQALEPDVGELADILRGVKEFYSYCGGNRLIANDTAKEIATACDHLEFYRERIASFHTLTGEEYPLWCRHCPVE